MLRTDNRVMIVDDSQFDLMFIKKALKDEFDLYTASSADEALDNINEINPKVILLDVKMNGMSGFELCRKIKEQEQFRHCRILFISSLESVEEKLMGFECGAADFLSKPVVPSILRKRVRVEIENFTKVAELDLEKKYFFDAAMDAITSSGEVGVVLAFTRQLFEVSDDGQLAELLLKSLEELGVSASLCVKTHNGVVLKSNRDSITELERKLLVNLDKADRIFEFGRQLIFNYGSVCILVRGYIEDDLKRARYKDIIALMADSAVAFLKKLERDEKFSAIGSDAKETIKIVQKSRLEHGRHMDQLLVSLMMDLENVYVNWDLTEGQESILVDTVSRGLDSLNSHREQGEIIEMQLDEILKRVITI